MPFRGRVRPSPRGVGKANALLHRVVRHHICRCFSLSSNVAFSNRKLTRAHRDVHGLVGLPLSNAEHGHRMTPHDARDSTDRGVLDLILALLLFVSGGPRSAWHTRLVRTQQFSVSQVLNPAGAKVPRSLVALIRARKHTAIVECDLAPVLHLRVRSDLNDSSMSASSRSMWARAA